MSRQASSPVDADTAVTELYVAHYRSLVRLAVLLVDDVGAAEEVVQDAYVRMHGAWRRIREPEAAVGYLRTTVLNLARSKLRRRQSPAGTRRSRCPTRRPRSTARWSGWNTTGWWPRCVPCRHGSGGAWCCATTGTCPRPGSPRRWGSARAR